MANLAAEPDNDDAADHGEAMGLLPSTGGTLAYVIGPVHGQLTLLRDLVAKLVADALAAKPDNQPHLIFMGDYLGGGSGTTEVLPFIRDLKARPIFEVHALQGRADRALLNFLEWPTADAPWVLDRDGEAILRAYGVDVAAAWAEPHDWADAAEQFRAALPMADLAFLKSLETLVSLGDYAFVHGGLRSDSQGGALGEIQWIRGSPFRQGYSIGHAKDGRQRQGTVRRGELFALRIHNTRQTVFQAAG